LLHGLCQRKNHRHFIIKLDPQSLHQIKS
jgi:hypothetical protein